MKKQMSLQEVEDYIDKSLSLYDNPDYISFFENCEFKIVDSDDIIEMYKQTTNILLGFQSQLIEHEYYEVCQKIKTLLDLEYKDVVKILTDMGYFNPENDLTEIRNHIECKYGIFSAPIY